MNLRLRREAVYCNISESRVQAACEHVLVCTCTLYLITFILGHIKYMCKALSIVATMGYKSVAVIERCTWLFN